MILPKGAVWTALGAAGWLPVCWLDPALSCIKALHHPTTPPCNYWKFAPGVKLDTIFLSKPLNSTTSVQKKFDFFWGGKKLDINSSKWKKNVSHLFDVLNKTGGGVAACLARC